MCQLNGHFHFLFKSVVDLIQRNFLATGLIFLLTSETTADPSLLPIAGWTSRAGKSEGFFLKASRKIRTG